MEIDLKSKINILELQAWMDGGSVTLICINEKKQKFKIHFQQNMFWEIRKGDNLPGRIYFNDVLIKQSSNLEKLIVKSLEKPSFMNHEKLDKEILTEKIEYIKSETYITDIEKVKYY